MKNKYKEFLIVALMLAGQHAYAATVSWDDVDYTAGLNDVFTLDIVGSDFSSNVDGGGVNILFDASVLNVLSVSIDGGYWDFFNDTGTINNGVGTVNGIMVNAFSSVIGDFTVASVEFQAIGTGVTDLTLNEFSLNPWASSGSLIDHNYINGSVTVSSVPVPAAAWLFGSALIGLAGIKRKK
ncbi:VPLPA-CTERM sorting domain-containing protein [Oceanicoccus sagamiensis]|uniref:PEP-CTERM protein-sorting domain-containing protein n=1 Tax=Oceanicoccus sagamiensis TaxID=716816 RepID=A0A1X9NPB6_9GAMM|nr:VPLPA-CTERM sorting domain-containing protein [Oceanicoccus sagamiensis]ARN75733.1 hypothetical protein BST96_17445 [Oceanicoccus sagamiensis]